LISGVARSGGQESATAVTVPAFTNATAATWLQTLQNDGVTAEHLTLTVSLSGTLPSGAPVTSETLQIPLEVCIDCGGVTPSVDPYDACPTGTVLAPDGEGPCCAPQDFTDTCTACGGLNDPCCGGSASDGGAGTCNAGLTCTGPALPASTCGYPNSVPGTCVTQS
jgi:hypothetical protein